MKTFILIYYYIIIISVIALPLRPLYTLLPVALPSRCCFQVLSYKPLLPTYNKAELFVFVFQFPFISLQMTCFTIHYGQILLYCIHIAHFLSTYLLIMWGSRLMPGLSCCEQWSNKQESLSCADFLAYSKQWCWPPEAVVPFPQQPCNWASYPAVENRLLLLSYMLASFIFWTTASFTVARKS